LERDNILIYLQWRFKCGRASIQLYTNKMVANTRKLVTSILSNVINLEVPSHMYFLYLRLNKSDGAIAKFLVPGASKDFPVNYIHGFA
jgi:hypothetical protein